MMGNLWEWCLNKYDNPKAWNATKVDKSGQRVFRGGSWDNDPVYLRSSTRYRDSAVYWDFSIGFRLVQDSN